MSGKFESFAGTSMEFADGSSHEIAKDATVTLSIAGAAPKTVKIADLKKGDQVSLSGSPAATSVVATRA